MILNKHDKIVVYFAVKDVCVHENMRRIVCGAIFS